MTARPMVFGVGFGRTGTISLREALQVLGYGPCYHMKELFDHPERLPLWEAAWQAAGDWTSIFAGYRSAVGWPTAYFWPELVSAFPASRFILTTRDPDEWYASARSTLYASVRDADGRRRTIEDETRAAIVRFNESVIWNGTFGGRFAERRHALQVLARHEHAVRTGIPADRLLVFGAADGWATLCAFLGVEVPDTPFPHLNTRTDFVRATGLDN